MTARKTSLSNSFGRALLSPYAATFILSRRSLQRVQEKVRLQLEYPPVFRAPVAGGVIFLTGDDTAMIGFTFALGLLLEYYHTQILGYKIKYVCLSRPLTTVVTCFSMTPGRNLAMPLCHPPSSSESEL